MNYYIADLHFGFERVLVIDKLNVPDVNARNRLIVDHWNKTVKDEDNVYIVGDVMWDSSTQHKAYEIVRQLKGNKYLVTGNHDKITLPELKACFAEINPVYDITDEGRQVFLSHYPIMFYPHQHKKGYMIYGHVHKSFEYRYILKWSEELIKDGVMTNMFNVGCMVDYMDFTPKTLDELIELKRKSRT